MCIRDRVILGEKAAPNGRKITPEKFVRKSFCSVLFVPEKTTPIRKIWVPTDFSENSRDALNTAIHLREIHPGAEIICHHVFETPSIDLIESEMRKDYVDHFRKEAQQQFEKYIEDVPKEVPIDIFLTPWLYASVSDHIKEDAEENLADIILMSSGGKSRFSTLFIGSSTSELIKLEKKIPVVILKERIDRVTAWDVLTNL